MAKMSKILEQYERVNRWYRRLQVLERQKTYPSNLQESKKVVRTILLLLMLFKLKKYPSNLKPSKKSRDNYIDIAYAFFMNCYHLADWIDKSKPKNKSYLDPYVYVNESSFLKFSYDLCIKSKHLKIYPMKKKVDEDIGLGRLFRQGVGSAGRKMTFDYVVTYKDKNGNKKNDKVIDLAKSCISEWNNYLNKEGLIEQALLKHFKQTSIC